MRALLISLLAAPLVAASAPVLLSDPMDDAALWLGEGSDSVRGESAIVAGAGGGKAVALSYDYGRVSGYAFMRRKVDLRLPDGFEVRFKLRGQGGRNDLQMKLTQGDTVYWKTWPNFAPPGAWTEVRVPASEIGFAWGPEPRQPLTRIDGIEFVVARNRDGGAGRIEVDALEILPAAPVVKEIAPSLPEANAVLAALAGSAPLGEWPRAFLGEQPYWTIAGSDGGAVTALISEDGAIEPYKGGFSIEPAMVVAQKRTTWANGNPRQSLAEGYLPIPSVTLSADTVDLTITSLVDPLGRGQRAGYTLVNRGTAPTAVTLELAVRPWQVNPPAQFLSQQGGYSPILSIAHEGSAVAVTVPGREDGSRVVHRLVTSSTPDDIEVSRISAATARHLALATATLRFRVALKPGERRTLSLAHAPSGTEVAPWDALRAETERYWRDRLNRIALSVPPGKQAFADTLRTSLAHILVSRQGPMLKPGTRSYDRAWIRDGAMMNAALLRSGAPQEARAFVDWYGAHLFENGKVPCCVDFRGADPVPENDSHGEYIYAVAELYRFTGDRVALAEEWPGVLGAWRYMEALRAKTRIAENRTPERRMLFGLMPPSISHEGYSAKPQYSLWDDFWALRGYRDAAELARLTGAPEADAIAASRDEFAVDLKSAIEAAAAHWKIDYVPGATSLGDFDATSTTVALDPVDARDVVPPALLKATFERYWNEFVARRDGAKAWQDYTPYELRTVGTFVRLGWRERAQELLDFFFRDRRPAAWNGWAEVVGRDYRQVRFIGDMPHAWVASDFVRSALDMFAYAEKPAGTITLGGGLTSDWLAGSGSTIRGLTTEFGTVDLAIRGDRRRIDMSIAGSARPPRGFRYVWPFAGKPPKATVDGRILAWVGDTLTIPATGRAIRVRIGR